LVALERPAESEIDATGAREGADSFFKRGDAVIGKASGSTPDNDVATFEAVAAWAVFAGVATEEKRGGQAERYRDDGLVEIQLVLILMQGEAGPGLIAVDEAGVGLETRESAGGGGTCGELREESGHGGPRVAGFGIDFGIAIALAIGDPADFAAVGDGDGHAEATGRDHVAKGRSFGDGGDLREKARSVGCSEATEKDGAFAEGFGFGGEERGLDDRPR